MSRFFFSASSELSTAPNKVSDKENKSAAKKAPVDHDFVTRTRLREQYNIPLSGEKTSNSLVSLFAQEFVAHRRPPDCLKSAQMTAEKVISMPDQPAASVLPAPVITQPISSHTLTHSESFSAEIAQHPHAIIQYPKVAVENNIDKDVNSEMHTVYFGRDEDSQHCMLFDPDVRGGYIKAPCKPLIRYFAAHIGTLYDHKSDQPATLSVTQPAEDNTRTPRSP